ncbi:MAG: patatin-like phospholipase family protein [Deltaproteobacteria bacterium]|nr:patatin-like phospholipase family protein [Deltaproteobacteria bacterium]
MNPSNILAMDGGNGFNTASILTGLQKQLTPDPSATNFLNGIDLFAGTSDGGINALFLAAHQDPTAALADIDSFWQSILKDMNPCASAFPGSLLLAFMGQKSILSSKPMEETFIEFFGQDTTLDDLEHPVLIVSFKLDNEREHNRRWVPKYFSNWGPHATGSEKVVDVALRTSALPIEMPIYQGMDQEGPGYVDGGMVANNPSMCAIAQLIEASERDGVSVGELLGEMSLLSIGTGRNVIGDTVFLDPDFHDGRASWGYSQWLFDASRPLLLVDLMLQAAVEAVSKQCHQILRKSFFRAQPTLEKGLVPDDPATTELLKEVILWMRSVGWIPRAKAGRKARTSRTSAAETAAKKSTPKKATARKTATKKATAKKATAEEKESTTQETPPSSESSSTASED